ncbi:MAG: hypothetical protein ACSHXK_13700 [Oceanococcus sp.]
MKMTKKSLILFLFIGLLPIAPACADAAPSKSQQDGPTAAFSIGLGGGLANVDSDACQLARRCSGAGNVFLLSGRFHAFLGPITLGGRIVKDMEDESEASEAAALIGLRPGRSPVSLMIGPGKIRKANDGAREKVSVMSWEILIAPHGRNVQFIIHGASGEVDYAAFSFAASFGHQ